MTPLPAALGGSGLVVWRVGRDKHLGAWHTAEGAFRVGGRWSSAGRRVLNTSLDPATTILEVAVHKGFDGIDTVPHSLLALGVNSASVHIVPRAAIPDVNWLRPGLVSAGQQRFGDALLMRHALKSKASFALDPRLAAGALR